MTFLRNARLVTQQISESYFQGSPPRFVLAPSDWRMQTDSMGMQLWNTYHEKERVREMEFRLPFWVTSLTTTYDDRSRRAARSPLSSGVSSTSTFTSSISPSPSSTFPPRRSSLRNGGDLTARSTPVSSSYNLSLIYFLKPVQPRSPSARHGKLWKRLPTLASPRTLVSGLSCCL